MDEDAGHSAWVDRSSSAAAGNQIFSSENSLQRNANGNVSCLRSSGPCYYDADLEWVPTASLRSLAHRCYPWFMSNFLTLKSWGSFFVDLFGLHARSYDRKRSDHESHDNFFQQGSNCVVNTEKGVEPKYQIDKDVGMDEDDPLSSSHAVPISIGSRHTSFFHFIPRGFPIDEFPLEAM